MSDSSKYKRLYREHLEEMKDLVESLDGQIKELETEEEELKKPDDNKPGDQD